ncbi:endonuclease/exonuclease/phosphatase family protein [Pedobacter sp. MR2016-24]|uniref:endonuclease/exonuclease/phosphatase family protein n=1 Tax=Pedobacter sp. MR2016-24 TaxID=2994466 RepID=UPI00224660F8|nr:endonuclease/exonuclease/phosphatase family protein [Pedobacter sp. MR2016-24]MCX2486375.1 endonuclease/exonuclease/phosphatase family protein [Pedobacter sp. MR2016-24]
MKYKNILLLIVVFTITIADLRAQDLNIASYNIRYNNPGDSLDAWPHRKDLLRNMVRFYDFDVFGVQEALAGQIKDLSEMDNYSYVGVGRDDGKTKGEYAAIFYKKDRLNLISSGTFWLSATDTEHPNKGWDAVLPRICTWASFQDKKTGLQFYHFNTHFDHVGVEARRESSKLIMRKMKEIAGTSAVMLTGDFNVSQENESYHLFNNSGFLKDAFDTASIKLSNSGTFNGFKLTPTTDRIDHVFLSNAFTARRYGVLTNSFMGHFPSDHFPVMVVISQAAKN